MILIGVSFDNAFTCSCVAPDFLRLQKKETVIDWLCTKRSITTDEIDEIIVVDGNEVIVWKAPF